ncbi:hypothetical protein [Dyadobacter beijingensis]|nr:hypothetical protein [Dyadobacter beijingensis]
MLHAKHVGATAPGSCVPAGRRPGRPHIYEVWHTLETPALIHAHPEK